MLDAPLLSEPQARSRRVWIASLCRSIGLTQVLTGTVGLAGPLCGMMDAPTLVVFVVNAVALLVLSEQLAAAALRLASLAGDTYGGLVTATLSNSVEFLIAVLALRKQMLRFVQVTLLGSVLFGSLLVPGVSFIARGIKHLSHLKQKHNKHAAGMHSMVLLLAAFSYGVPAAYNATSAAYGRCRTYCYEKHMLPLSRLVAAVLLPCYALMLVWSTVTHAELLRRKRESVRFSEESQPHHLSPLLEEAEEEEADVALPSAVAGEESLRERRRVAHVSDASSQRDEPHSVARACAVALGLTAWIGVCAEQLLATVDPAAAALGVTRHFVALVIIPLVGNVDTLLAATKCALLGNTELALALGVGSAIQVAMGVLPLLVLLCWAVLRLPLTVDLRSFEAAVLVLSTLVATAVVRRARSTYLEGVLLLGAYCIVAISYLFRSREEDELAELAGEGPQLGCECDSPCCAGQGAPHGGQTYGGD